MNGKYTFRILVLLLNTLLLGGCFAVGTGVGQTPEQAAAQSQPPPADVQRVYVVKPAPNGSLVIHRDIGTAAKSADNFTVGFAYVTPEWFGWTAHENGGMGGMPDTEELALFTDSPDTPTNHTIIVGLTKDPNVNTAVATFGTGQTMRDHVVNGLFGMVAEPKTPPCQLELLNARGERIKLIDFRNTGSAQHVEIWADRIQKDCPKEDSQ